MEKDKINDDDEKNHTHMITRSMNGVCMRLCVLEQLCVLTISTLSE